MGRQCAATGKGVMSGHRVSHSNIKSKRRFEPNLQVTSLLSDALGVTVRLRLSPHGLRSIEHAGGLDAFLLATPAVKLTDTARKLKRRVSKAIEKRQAGESASA